MDIENIKNWLDEAIEFFEEVVSKKGTRRDIQQNIEENRRIFGVPFRKREEIKTWVIANKPNALPYLAELKGWLEEWNSYFKAGFRPESGETIDTLPGKIVERLRWIRERIESL